MLIRRELINATLPATESKPVRGSNFNLAAIYAEPSGRICATDGHVFVTARQEPQTPDTEFPIVPGAPFHGSPAAGILIPGDVAKRLSAATPKRSLIPVLSCVQLSTNGSPTTATLAATDLEIPTVATIHESDKRFPDVERVFSAAKGDTVTLPIAVAVLERMIAAAKAIAGSGRGSKTPIVTLHVPIVNDPKHGQIIDAVRFESEGIDGMRVDGVAMPIRLPK